MLDKEAEVQVESRGRLASVLSIQEGKCRFSSLVGPRNLRGGPAKTEVAWGAQQPWNGIRRGRMSCIAPLAVSRSCHQGDVSQHTTAYLRGLAVARFSKHWCLLT